MIINYLYNDSYKPKQSAEITVGINKRLISITGITAG